MAHIGNYSVFLHGEDHFDKIDVPKQTQEGDAIQQPISDAETEAVINSSVIERTNNMAD